MSAEGFSNSDWEEIYYALARKADEIEDGRLDDEIGEISRPDSETTCWVAHLREIMKKVALLYTGRLLP
jgi:hypothetical protein